MFALCPPSGGGCTQSLFHNTSTGPRSFPGVPQFRMGGGEVPPPKIGQQKECLLRGVGMVLVFTQEDCLVSSALV